MNYYFNYVKNTFGNSIGMALNLQVALGVTILIFPVQEHGMSLHLFVTCLISFSLTVFEVQIFWFFR